MSSERDVELGRRLGDLPSPEPAPDFWARLGARLREEEGVDELSEARRRRGRGRALAVLAVAALVAVVVGLVAIDGGTGDRRVETEPAAPPRSEPPRMVTGRLTSAVDEKLRQRAGTLSFARAIDGSYAMRNELTGETVAYDASTGRSVSWAVIDGAARGTVVNNAAPGRPERRPVAWFGDHGLEDFVVATAHSDPSAVQDTTVLGRPAWRWAGTARGNEAAGTRPTRLDVVVDQETGVLLRLTTTAGGEALQRLTVEEIAVHQNIDRRLFAPPLPEDATARTADAGFRRFPVDELPFDELPAAALVPPDATRRSLEDGGWTLEGVWYGSTGKPTGPEASNPAGMDVTYLVHRDGWRRVVTSLRRFDGPADRWDDPFRGEGQVFEQVRVELSSPDQAGGRAWTHCLSHPCAPAQASRVMDPTTVPHLWAVAGGPSGYVLTVSGPATADELTRFAEALRPRSY